MLTPPPAAELSPAVGLGHESLHLPDGASELHWRAVAVLHPPGAPAALSASFIPANEDADNWHNRITARVLLPGQLPGDTAMLRLNLLKSDCMSLEMLALSSVRMNGGFDSFAICTHPAPRPKNRARLARYEAVWLRGIFGKEASYLIERDWRGDDPTDSVMVSDQARIAWRSWFVHTGLRQP